MVAAYNAEAFIGRCLLSLLSQTVATIEVVLVDDGSSDNTCDVARQLAQNDHRLTVVSQPHQGVSAARNRGLRESHGDFVGFVDADDYVHPQYVERLLGALTEYPEAEMAMAPSVRTSSARDVSMSMYVYKGSPTLVDGAVLRQALFVGTGWLSFQQCHVCHGKLFRRQLLDSLSFPERYAVCEDAVFMCKVFQRITQAVWVDARLYFWYQHGRSVLHGGLTKARIDSLQAYMDCREIVADDDVAVRTACLRRIITHGQWLRHLATATRLQPAVDAVVRSVDKSLRHELFTCGGLTIRQRLHLLLLSYSRHYRKQHFGPKKLAEQPQTDVLSDIGKAPEEQNGMVSVVIPIYNMAPWLRECLDSVVGQKYRNLEIILVDDGSTDGSGDICEEYARRDNRIRVIHQSNAGLSAARNAGLCVATGDYVLMPDGDDVLHPQLVSLARKALLRGNFPFAMVLAKEMRTASDFLMEPLRMAPLRLLSQWEFIGGLTNRSQMGVNCHVAWNKLYRRTAIARHRFEDTAAEDTLFNARLAMDLDSIVVVDAPLYGWRQREGSLSRGHSNTTKQADRLLSLRRCVEAMPAGSRYEAWFKTYLHNDISRVLSLYRGTPLARHARWVVFRVRLSMRMQCLRRDFDF